MSVHIWHLLYGRPKTCKYVYKLSNVMRVHVIIELRMRAAICYQSNKAQYLSPRYFNVGITCISILHMPSYTAASAAILPSIHPPIHPSIRSECGNVQFIASTFIMRRRPFFHFSCQPILIHTVISVCMRLLFQFMFPCYPFAFYAMCI